MTDPLKAHILSPPTDKCRQRIHPLSFVMSDRRFTLNSIATGPTNIVARQNSQFFVGFDFLKFFTFIGKEISGTIAVALHFVERELKK